MACYFLPYYITTRKTAEAVDMEAVTAEAVGVEDVTAEAVGAEAVTRKG